MGLTQPVGDSSLTSVWGKTHSVSDRGGASMSHPGRDGYPSQLLCNIASKEPHSATYAIVLHLLIAVAMDQGLWEAVEFAMHHCPSVLVALVGASVHIMTPQAAKALLYATPIVSDSGVVIANPALEIAEFLYTVLGDEPEKLGGAEYVVQLATRPWISAQNVQVMYSIDVNALIENNLCYYPIPVWWTVAHRMFTDSKTKAKVLETFPELDIHVRAAGSTNVAHMLAMVYNDSQITFPEPLLLEFNLTTDTPLDVACKYGNYETFQGIVRAHPTIPISPWSASRILYGHVKHTRETELMAFCYSTNIPTRNLSTGEMRQVVRGLLEYHNTSPWVRCIVMGRLDEISRRKLSAERRDWPWLSRVRVTGGFPNLEFLDNQPHVAKAEGDSRVRQICSNYYRRYIKPVKLWWTPGGHWSFSDEAKTWITAMLIIQWRMITAAPEALPFTHLPNEIWFLVLSFVPGLRE